MKNNLPEPLSPAVSARHEAMLKTEYEKNGARVFFYSFEKPDVYALAFEVEIGGDIFKGVFLNGKLRRATRRKVVRASLLAFKLDLLQDAAFGGQRLRGLIFHLQETEVKDA